MTSKSSIDIVIGTVCKFTGIDAAKRGLKSLAQTVGRNLTNIKSGFDMARSAVSKFVSLMSKGMAFERMTTTFKTLTGSLETAKAHMLDLQDLGRTPPFDIEAFAGASQMMMKMTDGMLGYKKSLEMVGDIAAATGNDINAVARSVGLAYQMLRDGQPFGRAGSQMVQLGILTKAQVEHFDNLSKSGGDNLALWNELTQTLGKYTGAMAETESTTKGMVEAIEGEATVAMTELSAAISESAKPALEGLLGWLKRINEDGTIEDWADAAAESLTGFIETAKAAISPLSALWKVLKTPFESAGQAIGGAVGALAGGGSLSDAASAAWQGVKAGANDVWDADGAAAEHKESRRAAKAKRRAEAAAKVEAEAQERIAADMERAQAETDRKAAEEKAKADAEAIKKREADERKEIETIKKEREKAENELHALRIANAKDELKVSQNAASAASNTASYAATEFDKAFGMYRSEDHGAAQIAEERAYAADYKRLGKDAARYGGKWRIDELAALMAAGDTKGQAAKLEEWRKSSSFTPEVESMVRAAAADQTKTTAEDELRQINANTKNLAEKLDKLMQVK